MGNASDINKESVIQRIIRDNALAALMVVLALVSLINGLIIGVGIAVMINHAAKVDQLQRQAEINAAWQANVMNAVRAANIQVPNQPIEDH